MEKTRFCSDHFCGHLCKRLAAFRFLVSASPAVQRAAHLLFPMGLRQNPRSSGFCVLTQFARWGGVFTPGPKATLTGFQAQGVRTTESETGGGP